jgi:hypothetical protein
VQLEGWRYKMDYRELLHSNTEAEYGVEYKTHLLEMYKIYLDLTEKISLKRQTANNYFLTINTALIGLVSYLHLGVTSENHFYFLIALAGMILCFLWYRIIKSYKGLNKGRFKIIHLLEKKLPVSPYDAEWEALGRGKNKDMYHPFTHVEIAVPWVFFCLHLIVFLLSFF